MTRAAPKIRTLLVRDGNLCWLCGEPFTNHGDGAPTLDHVIPRSKGGVRANSNLRLAHRRCNHLRGDRPAEEWFLAFHAGEMRDILKRLTAPYTGPDSEPLEEIVRDADALMAKLAELGRVA